tara:strand:+ start:530 stop:817 length:288 start_codon:yes stop_codon:yes gene_type:complete
MVLKVGKEKDGTPVVFGDIACGTLYRIDYRDSRAEARKLPTEDLEAVLNKYEARISGLNPVFRFFKRVYNKILPAPDVLAYTDELNQRRQQDPQQ